MIDETSSEELADASPEVLARQAYHAAVRLLGSRDHSVFELTRKLSQREHSENAIESAINDLIALNYVNDTRYAQLYTEQRLAKGYGPLSVRAKLRERGIASHLVEAALSEQNMSWAELAQAAIEAKFDASAIISRDQREVARISRFLASRGFSSSDALRALMSARASLQS